MKTARYSLSGILAMLLLASRLVAQSNLSPSEVLRMLVPQNERFQFVATPEGPQSMRVNPASVAASRGINLHYNLFLDRGKVLEHDISLQNFLFNIAYRRALDRSMDYHLNEYTLSLGVGVPEFTAGVSVNWMRSNLPNGSNGMVLNLGILIRPIERLSLGAAKSNINQPVLGGVKLLGKNIVGIDLHPFTETDRLILAVDAAMPNGGRLKDDVTYKFGASLLILEGLRIYGVYEKPPVRSTNRVSIGLELNIPNVDFSYDARFDEDKKYENGVAG
ncbi:MAG: hypothetical protein AABZ61_11980, partial [Bacteroidota bacterium]